MCLATPAVAETPEPYGDESIILAGATLQTLWEGGVLTEGPALAPAPDGSAVYFSDITFGFATGGRLGLTMRYDLATGATTVFRSQSGMTNGMQFDAQGRLLSCQGADSGGRRVVRTDMKTGKTEVLAARFPGK